MNNRTCFARKKDQFFSRKTWKSGNTLLFDNLLRINDEYLRKGHFGNYPMLRRISRKIFQHFMIQLFYAV